MVQVKNITKSFGNGDNKTEVLKGISLTVEDGDFVVILGASGSGKSTLLNVMSGWRSRTGERFCMTAEILQGCPMQS